MAHVYNYNEDVAATMFISGLQVTHSFCKHLVKHEVTKMRDILFRVQKYIQIEDETAANRSPKKGGEGESRNHNLLHPRRARIELPAPSTKSLLRTRQRLMEKKRTSYNSKSSSNTSSAPSRINLW